MNQRMSILFAMFVGCLLTVGFLVGMSRGVSAESVPTDAIPVTCSAFSIDDANDTYLDCVENGGIDFSASYQSVPAGKYLFVTDIAMVPTQVFTTVTPSMVRFTRDPVSGSNNLFYEMRIVEAESKSVSFNAPIIRLNAGDRIYAENLTSNSFTNDARVFVTGWLTDSPNYVPTAVYGANVSVSQAGTPWWQAVLLGLLVVGTGAQFVQMRQKEYAETTGLNR